MSEPLRQCHEEDLSKPGAVERLAEWTTEVARSADGRCIKDGGRFFEGPAYYRLWRKRFGRVGVALPDPDPAAVRWERQAQPEKRRLNLRSFVGKRLVFRQAVIQHCGEPVASLMITGRVPKRAQVTIEIFGADGTYLRRSTVSTRLLASVATEETFDVASPRGLGTQAPALITAGGMVTYPFSLPGDRGERFAAMQRAVGGSVEIVYGDDGRSFVVNQDGIALGLVRNDAATEEARAVGAIAANDWIKGHCVVLPAE